VNTSANRHPFSARFILALALTTSAVGCTHEYQITPAYQRNLARIADRSVCARGESLAVSVTNQSGQPLDAGQVTAGIHTFNHQFTRDPALVLAEGLKAALRDGHCATASPGASALSVVLVKMEAHGEACGFVSCDGLAATTVSVRLQDSTGRVLLQREVSTNLTNECGMIFCNEEETSGLSTRALSETVGKTVLAIGDALAKRPAAESPVATPGS
jgi:hypothetical protein